MVAERREPDCPYCGNPMRSAVMACDGCGVEVRGRFRQVQFSRLPGPEWQFLERYLLAGFSIKALAEESGMGYVAIRNRLDRVIESYKKLHDEEQAKRGILERLERGEISADAAAQAIERL